MEEAAKRKKQLEEAARKKQLEEAAKKKQLEESASSFGRRKAKKLEKQANPLSQAVAAPQNADRQNSEIEKPSDTAEKESQVSTFARTLVAMMLVVDPFGCGYRMEMPKPSQR